MLPSTGLFKSIICPYYHGGGSSSLIEVVSCYRPYCHFKHVKKDEPEPKPKLAPPVPEYKPAPKLIKLSPMVSPSTKKKVKLEYRPENPELQKTSSSKHNASFAPDTEAPIYVPSSNIGVLNLDDCNEELDELTEIFDEELNDIKEEVESEVKQADEDQIEENEKNMTHLCLNGKVKSEKDALNSKLKDEVKIDRNVRNETTEKRKRSISGSNNKEQNRKERRDSITSNVSSTKHRQKSSHSSTERSSKDHKTGTDIEIKIKKFQEKELEKAKPVPKDKYKEKNIEKNKDKERAKDKEKDKKSSSSLNSSRSKINSSSSTTIETKHKHRSSISSASIKNKSPTSSSKHHSTSKDKDSSLLSSLSTTNKDLKIKKEEKPSSSKYVEPDSDAAELFATSEEDIMKECEMIYDQLELEFASMHKNESKQLQEDKELNLKRKVSSDDEQNTVALQRKRVAYENAEKHKGSTPLALHKPNHIRNAMQAIYHRQTQLRKKQEEETVSAENALRDAEEKVREANEALRKAKEKTMTPLIPKSFLTPPVKIMSRSIAPVANMLALERAKKKIEELRAEKKPVFTPAQTVRSVGRVAHKPTIATLAVEPEKKPKPPVLEATSTKISFNLRMQYYDMMVRHCMSIYPNAPDAWERAQTEELAVFKKCNTPMIYKSSALLAINKLRKEATDSGNKPSYSNKIVSHEVILAGKLAHSTSWSMQKKMFVYFIYANFHINFKHAYMSVELSLNEKFIH